MITPYNNQVQLLKKLSFATSSSSSSSSSNCNSNNKNDGDSSEDKDDTNAVPNPYSNNHFDATQSSLSEREWQRLFMDLEIRTVDGFQRGEKELIVLSLVRSNTPHREVDFNDDENDDDVNVNLDMMMIIIKSKK